MSVHKGMPDDADASFQPGGVDPYDDGLGEVSATELTQEQVDDIHRKQLQDTTLGYQRIILPEGATKAVAVGFLSRQIPQNEYQLPTFFYRSDFLPHALNMLTQEDADNATVSLYYEDGYPTFGPNKTSIFWNQLPHEPWPAYLLFQRFLEQAEEVGIRQIQLLAMENKIALETVSEYAQEFYWSSRAKAYDLFQVVADRKKREIRVKRTEDKHFLLSKSLLEGLAQKIEEAGEDFWSGMSAKESIETLRLLVNIQRVSMGETQNGGKANPLSDAMAGASGADLMRDVTKNIAQGTSSNGIDNNLRALMSDPSFALQAQALILQVRRGSEGFSSTNGDGAEKVGSSSTSTSGNGTRVIEHDA